MSASNTTDTPTTHMSTSGELPGLHGRLTVIPANPDDRAAVTEQLARLLERHRCNILVAGSTHVPFFRKIGDNSMVLNPGSVGLSLNGEPGADYALLSITESGLELEMDKVEYDFAAAAFEVLAWGLPTQVAEAIQHGRMPERMGSEADIDP